MRKGTKNRLLASVVVQKNGTNINVCIKLLVLSIQDRCEI